MSVQLNETHDPSLKSWVESANGGNSDFPIQNLPFCVFRRAGSSEAWRGGVAIGDQVVDLAALGKALDGAAASAAALGAQASLNALMAAGPSAWSALRLALSRFLRSDAAPRPEVLVAQGEAEYAVPANIGDYTDFYTSIHHATTVGKLFRPDNPLLPNYKWVPIGYHGRSSTIGISGQDFHRPRGQTRGASESEPRFGPCKRLDYELEVGIFIGGGNAQGESIEAGQAEEHVFGLCLLNDWSARDLQAWEYQPLGPFLAKNFGSTVSPWVITPEALAPFRIPQPPRPEGDPAPLPYLLDEADQREGALDLELRVLLLTPGLREHGLAPHRLSLSGTRHMYWTAAQMLAHHASNGCNLQPGDLLGTGTISGPTAGEAGAIVELSKGGREVITLAGTGEQRTFLLDDDTVILRGWCEKADRRRIGFGECRGSVLPALGAPAAV
jgi:fumarylacetoacetase